MITDDEVAFHLTHTEEQRVALARDRSTLPDVVALLARDSCDRVRAEVADHPSLRTGLLLALVEDSSPQVRAIAYLVATNGTRRPSVGHK